ncbi:MAG: hypothetical protein KKD18_03290 [Nanoarchaeota archaeon]|nr:hypothetical protein [Nanoarchaeota archaeon]MBU0977414.1 hypothetical protein [Nanoarchaeota archaeon]
MGDSPTSDPTDFDLLGQRVVERGLFDQPITPSRRVEVVEPAVERDEALYGQGYLFVPGGTDLTGQHLIPEVVDGRPYEA